MATRAAVTASGVLLALLSSAVREATANDQQISFQIAPGKSVADGSAPPLPACMCSPACIYSPARCSLMDGSGGGEEREIGQLRAPTVICLSLIVD
jgi:hypothetical protein